MSSDAVRQTTADSATIMGIVANLGAYPEWQPDATDVEVLETGDDGWLRRAPFEAKAGSDVRWRLGESELLTRNDGSYVLVDQGDRTTQVTTSSMSTRALRCQGPYGARS